MKAQNGSPYWSVDVNSNIQDIFAKNRSEESPDDNWEEFIIPPFINKLGIKTQTKAIVINGGRGSGKTTLLRYFCHASQFSSKRPHTLPSDALSHIGLYWRADTNFLNSFIGGEQSKKTWSNAFEHVLACELTKEIIKALRNLNCNEERIAQYGGLDTLDLSELQDFDDSVGSTLYDLEQFLTSSRRQLSVWVNNLDTSARPKFLPAHDFLIAFIETLQYQLPYLSNSTFAVFIDEYENLREEQQCFINGLLKHGSSPLIYNIAMKRNGWITQKTLGLESIQPVSDYIEIDIEKAISLNFELFSAELLFFRLHQNNVQPLSINPISLENLRSIEHLDKRYDDDEYRLKITNSAAKLFPRINERTACKLILNNTQLKKTLLKNISKALINRSSKIPAESFVNDDFPEASIIMPALIHRKKEKPNELLKEFSNLKNNENRFSPNNDLIQNNLFGCVNSIYIDSGKPSILFSGFSSLTVMSKGNIRYFLELIHRAFSHISSEKHYVEPEEQALAIKSASESILRSVKGSGIYGPQLYEFIYTLGSIFRELHRSLTQSEPEVNHFTISNGLTNELSKYLLEAEKWSVLSISPETKMKASGSLSSDYILNPIFAPFFQISFRKKRSIELKVTQLKTMLEGSQEERDALVRTIKDSFSKNNPNYDLFIMEPSDAE